MARVVLESLTKTFEGPRGEKVSALKDASLVVHDKEFLILVGPSGSGKTTLLRIIAGLEEIAQGTVSIDGHVVNHLPARDRDIAMVFQNYALYPHLTVYDNMALGLRLRKCSRAEILQRVTEAAEFLCLIPCLNRLPNELSGGQRQRVALGRALIRKPKVFLFDEPLSNLDTHLRAQVRAEILKLRQRVASTMIYVTHDQFEAMTMGDRIVVLKEGVIQQVAAPLELYNAPANLFVASFIGSPPMNFFHGTITAAGSSLYFGTEPIPNQSRLTNLKACLLPITAPKLSPYLGKQVTMGIRPEDITYNRTEDEVSSEVIAHGSVSTVEYLGPETLVYVRSGEESFVVRAQPSARLQSGERVSLFFNMRKAHFFDPITERSIL